MAATKNKPEATFAKKQYLMTDKGFVPSFLFHLSIMLSITILCRRNTFPSLTFFLSDVYHLIIDCLMRTANQFAWWSLLGLLSSACCAIQIILNTLSLGCASFNTVLGPSRPVFVAATVVAQGGSWYAAYQNGSIRRSFHGSDVGAGNDVDGVTMMLAGSLLSIVLTFMPEFLSWNSAKRQGLSSDDDRNGVELRVRVESMGCASCVSTVSKVIESCNGVTKHSISFGDGIVRVIYERELIKSTSSSATNDETLRKRAYTDLEEKLTAAGFPPRRI